MEIPRGLEISHLELGWKVSLTLLNHIYDLVIVIYTFLIQIINNNNLHTSVSQGNNGFLLEEQIYSCAQC